MTTVIEDNQLEAELQELYLVDKQWLSDLEFLDTELEFLRKLAATSSAASTRDEELNKLVVIENTYNFLKKDLRAYLHQLEPLIIAKSKLLDLSLIENYGLLKTRLAGMFQQCQKLKKEIFEATKADLTEATNQVILNDHMLVSKNTKKWRELF
jgi:hypothetical protein